MWAIIKKMLLDYLKVRLLQQVAKLERKLQKAKDKLEKYEDE